MFKHQFIRLCLMGVLVALLLCVSDAGGVAAFGLSTTSATMRFTEATSGSAKSDCPPLVSFNRENFAKPTEIDNAFYPLVPGTQFILDGSIVAGGKTTKHRVVFTVTDLTKVIDGVKTRVLWDTDTNNGELAESEFAFQAQDNDGNVWVAGEYPEEYENGKFIGADSTWISGVQRAQAGVLVPGKPKLGTSPFRQGYSPKIDFFDCGQVAGMGQKVNVPAGNFKNVLVINEWDPLDPAGGIQQKFYGPGVGVVKIGALNDPEAEIMTLTKVKQLSPSALDQAREEALRLDRRGYKFSKVYGKTPPMERTP